MVYEKTEANANFDLPRDQTGDHAIQRFCEEEDGSTLILSLFTFVFMMVMAGLGIDLMRFEMERTHLQATLDSAVLAGAGAPVGTDKVEIKEIVEDYFDKSDMSDYLHEIDADGEGEDDIIATLNATSVFAEASMDIDTHLMQLSGVDTLSAQAAAKAEVRTPKLEVSLVLDVSGSMAGSKMTNLKTAAKSFVATILNGADPGDAVISLVPFSFNVSPGPEIYDALTVNESHDYTSCLRFDASDFNSAAIDPDTSYTQQIYTAVYGGWDDFNTHWMSCQTANYAQILPFSMSVTDLQTQIDTLVAAGNTSGHLGMKWGAAMLDPAFDDVFDALSTASVVDATLDNLPATYTEADTLKIIVMMADGYNTSSYYFDDDSQFRGPNSDLYYVEYQEMEFQYAYRTKKKGGIKYSNDESKCSKPKWTCVYEATGDVISAHYLNDNDGTGYYNVEEDDWITNAEFAALQDLEGFISSDRLTWEEAWGLMTPEWYDDIVGGSAAYDDYVNSQRVNGSTKDARMRSICTATKNQGVVVYTIGFEVPSGGTAETELQFCASSANHYYPTNGANISSAFNSIASNVQNLRLTQ